jgi:hypothetical protein
MLFHLILILKTFILNSFMKKGTIVVFVLCSSSTCTRSRQLEWCVNYEIASSSMVLHTNWLKTKIQNIGAGPTPGLDAQPDSWTSSWIHLSQIGCWLRWLLYTRNTQTSWHDKFYHGPTQCYMEATETQFADKTPSIHIIHSLRLVVWFGGLDSLQVIQR